MFSADAICGIKVSLDLALTGLCSFTINDTFQPYCKSESTCGVVRYVSLMATMCYVDLGNAAINKRWLKVVLWIRAFL